MSVITRGSTTLSYCVRGFGEKKVLLIASGGMRSSMSTWQSQPWDAWTCLGAEPDFTVIAMDQRNAGGSRGPLSSGCADLPRTLCLNPESHRQRQGSNRILTSGDDYADDQLAVLDSLGIERCLLVGQCIGPSFIFRLLRRAPSRFPAAILLQPIGVAQHTTEPHGWEGKNVDATTHWFGSWAHEMLQARRASRQDLAALYDQMLGPDCDGPDFVFSASRDEVAALDTPLLVTPGKDAFHPSEIAREIVRLAPCATLLERWRDEDYSAAVHEKLVAFLRHHHV